MEFAEFICTPKLDNVRLHSQLITHPVVGGICLTFSHLIFSSKKCESSDDFEIWVKKIITNTLKETKIVCY